MLKPADQCNQLKPSYIREILKAAASPGMISLAGGLPAGDLFPLDLLQEAFGKASATRECFQYGLTEGEPQLQQHIRKANSLPETHSILVTTGSQQALDLIARTYINPGDKILVETPCYLGALQAFQLAGADIIFIEQDNDGPDTAQLEAILQKYKPTLFYAVPDFHNPTGVCWSLEKRQYIASLLNKSSTVLIEDAPYRALRYTGSELPYLGDMLTVRHFRLESFSKVMAPGLRVGYVTGEKTLLQPLVTVKQASDLHSTRITQAVVADILAHPRFPQHIENLKKHYKQRRDILANEIHKQLSDKIHFTLPEGGMFLWATVKDANTDAIARRALQYDLAIVPSSAFYTEKAPCKTALRLNFSHSSNKQLIEAVTRLKKVLSVSVAG